jgi:hypothetical protein
MVVTQYGDVDMSKLLGMQVIEHNAEVYPGGARGAAAIQV